MPIIYDKLYDKLKYIPTKALYNGGYYLDIFNGTPGYLTKASADKNIYLERIEGYLSWKWGILITDPAHPYVSKPPLIS